MTSIIEILTPHIKYVERTPRLTLSDLWPILKTCYIQGFMGLTDSDKEAILAYLKQTNNKRQFIFKSRNNHYTLILRCIFPSEKERNNVSRYATVLAYLRKESVTPADMFQTIHDNGGLTNLYWIARGRTTRKITRNKLHLNSNVTVECGVTYILEVTPQATGVFTLNAIERKT